MTVDPDIQSRHHYTYQNYLSVRAALVGTLHEMIVATTRDAFPSAETLVVLGEYAEDGLIIRAQKVTDGSGRQVAGYDDGGESTEEEWDAFTDTVDTEFLDFLGELTGDDYLGETDIDLLPPKDPK